MTDGRYKLIINLLDTDEFYDLLEDPVEERNLVADSGCTGVRNRLHDVLLDEMNRVRDPFRSFAWGSRSWRSVREMFHWGGEDRERPVGFSFESESRQAQHCSDYMRQEGSFTPETPPFGKPVLSLLQPYDHNHRVPA